MGSTELGFFSQLVLFLFSGFMIWLLYRFLKQNPEALSKKKLVKSLGTLGWLGIGLIVMIAICVALLKQV